MVARLYGAQHIVKRGEALHDWMLGIDEVQISVQKTKWYGKYEWWVDRNITRKTHPLSGVRRVAEGKRWTRKGAWLDAGIIVNTTHCQPMQDRRMKR